MSMNLFVIGALEITTKEEAFDPPREIGVFGQYIFEHPMLFADLSHEDTAVFFDDVGLDLSGVARGQNAEIGLTPDDGAAHFRNTARAQGVGLPGKTQRGCGAFVALQHPTGSPVR